MTLPSAFREACACWSDYLLRPPRGPARFWARDTLALLLAACAWYLWSYFASDISPSWDAHGAAGWLDWWDQGQYAKQAAELAHGRLKPGVYWFGYPALAAPFYRLLPRHAFLIPDLAMTLVMVAAYYAACRKVLTRIEAWLLVGVFLFFDPFLASECLVIPWNTLPAYTTYFLGIYLLLFGAPQVRHFFIYALAAGVAILARPTEIIALGLLFGCAVFRLPGWRERFKAGAIFAVVAAAGTLVTLALNFHFYQTFHSPYMKGEALKLNPANFGLKFYQFVFDTKFLTEGGCVTPGVPTLPLLGRYPEFLFLLPGVLLLFKERGWSMLGLVVVIGYALGFYLCYTPFDNPPYAWPYGQWHYIGWILPWCALLAYLARRAWRGLPRRVFLPAFFFPLLVALVIGFKAHPVAQSPANETGTNLRATTAFQPGHFLVTITATAPLRALDLRLVFGTPPPYRGDAVSTAGMISETLNGQPQIDGVDCSTSQHGNVYHFTFLAHGLALRSGDILQVDFQTTTAPILDQVELDDAVFTPFQALRNYLSPD